MLINSGKELGVFSSGNTLWSAEPDGISVYALDSGGLRLMCSRRRARNS